MPCVAVVITVNCAVYQQFNKRTLLLLSTVRRTQLSTVGDRAFPVAAARRPTWNGLPQHITSAPCLPVSRARLNTNHFSTSFLRPQSLRPVTLAILDTFKSFVRKYVVRASTRLLFLDATCSLPTRAFTDGFIGGRVVVSKGQLDGRNHRRRLYRELSHQSERKLLESHVSGAARPVGVYRSAAGASSATRRR